MRRLGRAHKGADKLSSSHMAFDTFPLTGIFALMMRLQLHTHTQPYSVSREVHPCTHKDTQIASTAIRPAILQLDKGSWQIVTPLPLCCLNCSPSACNNERLPVYTGSAFSLPLQLGLCFPSMDAGKKRGFNDAVVQLQGIRCKSY